jgi:hypothetical protein
MTPHQAIESSWRSSLVVTMSLSCTCYPLVKGMMPWCTITCLFFTYYSCRWMSLLSCKVDTGQISPLFIAYCCRLMSCSYLMPLRVAKALMTLYITCRVDRWLNCLLPTAALSHDAPPSGKMHDAMMYCMTCKVDRWIICLLSIAADRCLCSYLMPHQAVKGMMPWCTTWRVERWLNCSLPIAAARCLCSLTWCLTKWRNAWRYD